MNAAPLIGFSIFALAIIAVIVLKKRYAGDNVPTKRELNWIVFMYTGIFALLCYGLSFYQDAICKP